MPSPSENRAIDIFLAAFPGSEVITPDSTHVIPKPDMEAERMRYAPAVDEPVGMRKPKPGKERRYKPGAKKPGKNQGGIFSEET